MHLTDRLYGTVFVSEPVLLDLLASPTFRRLEGVLQHGITAILGITSPVSRAEHSIGVFLLVRRLGAGLTEQIAALLHDISHTAFSHVIDYVFDGHDSQSYHEQEKAAFLQRSELPALLERHGYDWRAFLDDEHYPLLEQPAPALCADRLDYFFRDSLDLGLSSLAQVHATLPHLVVHTGRITVDDLATARWLAETYLAADNASWSDFREVGLYELAARAIKLGLDLGALTTADLWTTDAAAWQRLLDFPDPRLQASLALVSPATRFVRDDAEPTFRLSTKLRSLDPTVLRDGRPYLLSEVDSDYAQFRREYLTRKAGKWAMRVIPPAP